MGEKFRTLIKGCQGWKYCESVMFMWIFRSWKERKLSNLVFIEPVNLFLFPIDIPSSLEAFKNRINPSFIQILSHFTSCILSPGGDGDLLARLFSFLILSFLIVRNESQSSSICAWLIFIKTQGTFYPTLFYCGLVRRWSKSVRSKFSGH